METKTDGDAQTQTRTQTQTQTQTQSETETETERSKDREEHGRTSVKRQTGKDDQTHHGTNKCHSTRRGGHTGAPVHEMTAN
jgi:hypothetical protein